MKKALITIPLIAIILCALMILQTPTLTVYASPEDAYGNDIVYMEIWQNGALKANFTSNGGSANIDANVPVNFVVCIKYNATLVTSQTEAVDYTKVLMNITYGGTTIWNNVELNNTSVTGPADGFYWLLETGNWTSNLPQAGTYTLNILYQGYY